MELTNNLWHKITFDFLNAAKKMFAFLGFLFTIYQTIVLLFPEALPKGWTPFLAIVFISLICGRIKTWKISKIHFVIPHTNTTLEIIFGDLFKQNGLKVISVNEFFDSELGKSVSNKTLHGILIEHHLQGKSFDNMIESQLSSITSDEVIEKKEGKKERYPIGTTVIMKTDADYLLFALSKTEPETCKAYCDVSTMWIALEGLWKKATEESGGQPINVPLVGSGQSGVGLPARDLLNLIVLSIINKTKEERISGKIRIILQHDHFEKLDLWEIRQYWKE